MIGDCMLETFYLAAKAGILSVAFFEICLFRWMAIRLLSFSGSSR